MAGYCSPAYIAAFRCTNVIDDGSSPDQSTVGLQKRVDAESRRARRLWEDRFGTTVADPTAPLFPTVGSPAIDAQQAILELFVLLRCAEQFARTKGFDVNNSLDLLADTLKRFGDRIEEELSNGSLDQLVLSAPLDLTAFCDGTDAAIDSAGFTASTDADNGPTTDIVNRLIQSFGVYVRALALDRSATAFDDALTADEAELYSNLNAAPVGALIAMVRRSNQPYEGGRNRLVNAYVSQAFEEIDEFRSGVEDAIYS